MASLQFILTAVKNVPIMYLIIAMMLNLILGIFNAFFYKALFYDDKRINFAKSYAVIYLSQILNFFAPFKTGAIIGKPLVTKLITGIEIQRSIPAIGFENIFSIIWQVTMLPLLLLMIGENVLFDNVIINVVLALFFLLTFGIAYYKYKWFLPRIIMLKKYVPECIKKIAVKLGINQENINKIAENMPNYLNNKKILLRLGIMTIANILLLPLFLWLSLNFLQINLGYFSIFIVYWISYILGRLSFLPAGIGIKDVTMGGLLISYGTNNVTALKVVLLFRILTLLPNLIISSSFLLYYGHKYTYSKFFKKELNA